MKILNALRAAFIALCLASPALAGPPAIPPSAPLSLTTGLKPATALYQVPGNKITSIPALGDSMTLGSYVTATQNYMYLLQQDLAASINNYGVTGAQMCDVSYQGYLNSPFYMAPPGDQPFAAYIVAYGGNDAFVKGAGAYEANFNLCQQAAASWLAIPTTYKTLGQAGTPTGTWVNDTNYYTGVATYSITNGSTLTLPITTYGKPIYLWYKTNDASGGTFTYKVDSGTAVSVNSAQSTPVITQGGNSNAIGVIRINGVAAGSHNVVVTVTSATNASNIVEILGVGTVSPLPQWSGPNVYVAGPVRQQNDTSPTATRAYNTDTANNVALLQGDGLRVFYVNLQAYVNTTTDMVNQLHPGPTGHVHVKQAFEAVMQPMSGLTSIQSSIFQSLNPAYAGLNYYWDTGAGATLSSTLLNSGYLLYGGFSTPFGLDLGYSNNSVFSTRLFAPATYDITLSTAAASPTSQSNFTDRLIVRGTGYTYTTAGFGDQAYNYATPLTGTTVTIADTQDRALLNPAGTLATLTVQLPTCSAAYDGKFASVSSTQILTALTVTATAGSIVGAPSTLGANAGAQFICRGANTTWYRVL